MSELLLHRRRLISLGKRDLSNVIYYTTTDDTLLTGVPYFNINPVVSNTYKNGLGTLIFENPVTTLSRASFSNQTKLLSIIFNDGLITIDVEALSSCSNLVFVSIPNTVTIIGVNAFNGCSSLTSITIPSSVTSIRNGAFINCPNLRVLKIDSNTVVQTDYLGSSPLSNAFDKHIETLILPTMCTKIGNNTFRELDNLQSVTIPESVISIGGASFYLCSSLTSIIIPSSVTSVGVSAFTNCTNLKRLEIQSSTIIGLDYLSSSALDVRFGRQVETLILANNCTKIGNNAFRNFSNVSSIIIPEGVTTIGGGSFHLWTSLTSVRIPSNVTTFGVVFSNCANLKQVLIDSPSVIGVTYSAQSTLAARLGTLVETLILTDNCTTIGTNAFRGMSNLTSVNIPSNTERIGASAFHACSSLASITLPNGVLTIGANAFNGCNFTSLHIPSSVVSVGASAFACPNLTQLQIDSSDIIETTYTTSNMLSVVFGTNVEAVTLPQNLTKIGTNAFRNFNNLLSITIPNGVTSIGSNSFSYCSKFTAITIPSSLKSLGPAAFSSCPNLKTVEINSPTVIGADYPGNLGLSTRFGNLVENLILADNCTRIGTNALRGFTAITSITIPDPVTLIGVTAFYACRALESIIIPPNVTTINSLAFIGCTNLKTLEIRSIPLVETDYITDGRLSNKFGTQIETLILPNCTRIGTNTFRTFTSLLSVTIPSSVTSIGNAAFDSCKSLTSITCLAIVPPTAVNASFTNIDKTLCVLYVPAESVDLYSSATGWNTFTTILPILS